MNNPTLKPTLFFAINASELLKETNKRAVSFRSFPYHLIVVVALVVVEKIAFDVGEQI